MNHRIITAVSVLLALQAGAAFAGSTMQGSVGLNYDTTDYSNNDKENSTGIDIEYYLAPVEKKSHPWREASFFERTASVNLEVNKKTFEPDNSEKLDGPFFHVGGTYASKSNPIVGTLLYENSEIKGDLPSDTIKRKTNLLGLGAGAFINESFAILALYIDSEFKTTYENSPQNNVKVSLTAYGLLGKYVYELPQQQAVNVEFQITGYDVKPEGGATQSDNSISLKGVYYVNPKVGIGGEFTKQSGDSDFFKGTQYGLGVDAFLTENISVTAQYTSFNADNSSGNDKDEWKIGARWWF